MDGKKISLRKILGAVSFVDCGDLLVSGISCDSRTVRPGDLFVALTGGRVNGLSFVSDAITAGATGIVVEHPLSGMRVPQCVVPDARTAWAKICMAWQNVSVDSLILAGVTGTNGKTTSTWLLRSILEAAGYPTGLLGTIEYSDGRESLPAELTTPDAASLARFLGRLIQNGTRHCVMEISSHAIDQRRCAAVPLSVAAVTNVTQDHFDYHGDVQNYLNAKAGIVKLLKPGQPLLVGIDDPGCRRLLEQLPASTSILSFGMTSTESALRAEILRFDSDAQLIQLQLLNSSLTVRTHLVGRHNVLNCLTAAAMAEQMGIGPDQIIAGLERVLSVPGRMERIQVGQPFQVFVDYAHTPDGLRHCIDTVREMTHGQVICVFGAGGDRDRQKRPLMARAAQRADRVVVTSDNPRSENPSRIIDEIMTGFDSGCDVERTTDRLEAIRRALRIARPGDAVVIAGRGHESMQQIGSRQISFDDRRIVRRLLLEQLVSAEQSKEASRSGGNVNGWSSVSGQIPA